MFLDVKFFIFSYFILYNLETHGKFQTWCTCIMINFMKFIKIERLLI